MKELADAEADRVEAEDLEDADDEDEDADGDTPPDESATAPDAEPDAPEPELSAEAFAAQLEKVLTLHGDNLRGLFGDAYEDMEACSLCGGLGATTPDSPVLDTSTMQCGRCRGHGILVTEAANPAKMTRQCPDCLGECVVPRPMEPVPIPQVVQQPAWGAQQPPAQPAPPPVELPPMPQYDAATNSWRDPNSGQIIQAAASQNHSTASLSEVTP